MKITHHEATFAALSGHYSEKIAFPDGHEGSIEFGFLWDPEYKFLREITSGLLIINSNQSVTFGRTDVLRLTRIGSIPEEMDITGIITEHFGKVASLMERAKAEIKFTFPTK